MEGLNSFFFKYGSLLCAIAAFAIPFTIYILTLEPKLVGGDTSWFAIYVPRMEVLVPTGYPSFSIFGKLATLLPIRDIACRLNLMSAILGALAVLHTQDPAELRAPDQTPFMLPMTLEF